MGSVNQQRPADWEKGTTNRARTRKQDTQQKCGDKYGKGTGKDGADSHNVQCDPRIKTCRLKKGTRTPQTLARAEDKTKTKTDGQQQGGQGRGDRQQEDMTTRDEQAAAAGAVGAAGGGAAGAGGEMIWRPIPGRTDGRRLLLLRAFMTVAN
jgi:hypothetical protein